MLDIHCHILPGIDDGAADMADTLAMARDAVATGCRGVCASSHLWEGLFGTSVELLAREHPKVVHALNQEGIALDVVPAAENYFGSLPPEQFAEKAVSLGPEGRYVLLDFSMRAVPPGIPEMLDALRKRGRVAVIAHPERNRELQADPRPVARWIADGALIQVNGGSVLGWLGEHALETANRLLEGGAVHVLASDAHGVAPRRPFCLDRARDAAALLVGADEAARMTGARPWKIVRGEDIEVAEVPPEALRRPRGIWRRLWNQ